VRVQARLLSAGHIADPFAGEPVSRLERVTGWAGEVIVIHEQ